MPCIKPYTQNNTPYSKKDDIYTSRDSVYSKKENIYTKRDIYSPICLEDITPYIFQDGDWVYFQDNSQFILND